MLAQPRSSRDLEEKVIRQFNGLLANRTQAFKNSHEGVKAAVVDTQKPFNTALDNPQRYGSMNATCWDSSGRSCLWFNDYHPGQVRALIGSNQIILLMLIIRQFTDWSLRL